METPNLFEYSDYKDFVNDWLRTAPNQGRGLLTQIAKRLGVHTSLVSHVLRGKHDFTGDQAWALAQFLGLRPLESEYLLTLVARERAGSESLRQLHVQQLARLKALSESKPLPTSDAPESPRALTEMDKAVFYSQWYYSAIFIAVSIEGLRDLESLHRSFNLPRDLIQQVLTYLVDVGMLRAQSGKYATGIHQLRIEPDSPMFARHHLNWRLKALERIPNKEKTELFATLPMSIAEEDVPAIRSLLFSLYQDVETRLRKSKPEKLFCLNFDFFRF